MCLTIQRRAPVVEQVCPPGLAVAVYPMMADLPVLVGAVRETRNWELAFNWAVTLCGAEGGRARSHVSPRICAELSIPPKSTTPAAAGS
jgi:hypothetical protein